MEPRPSERGNGPTHKDGSSLMSASMEPRPSERGNRDQQLGAAKTANGFNGATSFRTWKRPLGPQGHLPRTLLQWSHVLPNVETAQGGVDRALSQARFNGATSFRTWKPR